MKKLFFLFFLCLITPAVLSAQNCKVTGIVRYFYNDFIGYKPDTGAEVMFFKYNNKYKMPNIEKWDKYQTLMDNRRKYQYYLKYFSVKDSEEKSGFKESYTDSILALSAELLIEKEVIVETMIEYSTVVDASGKYEIDVPYGTYYVLFKSANRNINTLLENENKYYMIKVNLNSKTKILSLDFEL